MEDVGDKASVQEVLTIPSDSSKHEREETRKQQDQEREMDQMRKKDLESEQKEIFYLKQINQQLQKENQCLQQEKQELSGNNQNSLQQQIIDIQQKFQEQFSQQQHYYQSQLDKYAQKEQIFLQNQQQLYAKITRDDKTESQSLKKQLSDSKILYGPNNRLVGESQKKFNTEKNDQLKVTTFNLQECIRNKNRSQ